MIGIIGAVIEEAEAIKKEIKDIKSNSKTMTILLKS